MAERKFGALLGKGGEREVYENLSNPATCFKVSHKASCVQTKREIKYFESLRKSGLGNLPIIPKYFGSFEQGDYVGFEQECLSWSKQNDDAILLEDYIKTDRSPECLATIRKKLEEAYALMIKHNVIISDIHPNNILLILDSKNELKRLVFIDGFGSPELIPLPQYCPFFGRLKIQRQWKKFLRRRPDVKELLGLSSFKHVG